MRYSDNRTVVSIIAATFSSLLLPASNAADVNLGLAHQLVIVDHSGSMRGQYEWIGEAMLQVQTNQEVSTNFSLMEFSKNTRPIPINGKLFGNAVQFNRAVKQLNRAGGAEDGYMAIDDAISYYSADKLIAPHIILITDEHRTSVQPDVDVHSLSSKLAEAQLPVTAIVNVRFTCDDDRSALGMDSRGNGIVLDANGTVEECTIGKLTEPSQKSHSVSDYLDLALSTGGSAWDMLIPRQGKRESAKFARAFAQTHGAAIEYDLQQEDILPIISFYPDNPTVGDIVTFDASGTKAAGQDDYVRSWQWDFETNHQFDSNGAVVAHSFATPGSHEITLALSTDKLEQPISVTFKIEVTQ